MRWILGLFPPSFFKKRKRKKKSGIFEKLVLYVKKSRVFSFQKIKQVL
jgi:hypothetical protein